MPTVSTLTALSVLLALSAAHAASVPTLAQLQAAPEAKLETFGPIQSAGRICGWGLSKATKDYPARLLIAFWSMADRRFFATFVADLSTGAVRKVTEPGFDKDAPRWPSVVASDGKYFFSCMAGALAIYDPAKDSFQMVRPIAKASWLRGMALGADGVVYVSDYPTGSAARYDPATGAMEDYGPQGGPFNITNIYGYSVGSDGEWVYTAAGKIPWYVVAYNRKTRQQKNLFKFDQADFPNVFMRGGEVYLSAAIRQPARTEFYRLAGGQATRIEKFPESKPEGAQPPPAATGAGQLAATGAAQSGATVLHVPQPEVEIAERGLDMEEGGAVTWYRTAEDRERVTKAGLKEGSRAELGWRKLVFPIPGEPYRVRRIAPMGDGRLVVAMGIYGDVFLFDPAANKFMRVGNPANRNIYCLLPLDGKIYFGGYSNAFLGVFERGQSKLLHDWNRMLGSKRSLTLVAGADGLIYLGNQAEREFVGGSLAWWNPKTQEPGGIPFPNDECNWTISAMGGKLIVTATRAVADPAHPEVKATDGRLIVYSTEERRIVQQFAPLPGEKEKGSAGMIAECAPGKALGLTTFQEKPVMYVADILAGKALERVELPAPAGGDLQRGLDGQLYTFLGRTLVRIDPATCAVTPLCQAEPGRMAFIGPDLYLAGDFALRRIKGLAP